MNCCSDRCGWCGRCDDEPRREADEPIPVCDRCGTTCFHTLSLAGVGIACSRACLDVLARQHEAAMQKQSA